MLLENPKPVATDQGFVPERPKPDAPEQTAAGAALNQTDLLFWLTVSEWVIRLTMLPVIVLRKEKPATCLAWLTIVFFEPWIGLGLYLLIGENRLGRRRLARRRSRRRQFEASEYPDVEPHHVVDPDRDRRLQRVGPPGRARGRAAGRGRQLDLLDDRHGRGHRPADCRHRRRPATRTPAVLHFQGRQRGPAGGRGVGSGGGARRGVPRAGRRGGLAAALSPPGPVVAAAGRPHLPRLARQSLADYPSNGSTCATIASWR